MAAPRSAPAVPGPPSPAWPPGPRWSTGSAPAWRPWWWPPASACSAAADRGRRARYREGLMPLMVWLRVALRGLAIGLLVLLFAARLGLTLLLDLLGPP